MRRLRTLFGPTAIGAAHGDATSPDVAAAAGASPRWRPIGFDIKASCDDRHQDALAGAMLSVQASATGWKYLRAEFALHVGADNLDFANAIAIFSGEAEVGYLPSGEAAIIRGWWGTRIPDGLSLPGVAYGKDTVWSVRLDSSPHEVPADETLQPDAGCPECHGAHPPLSDDVIAWDPPTLWIEIVKEYKRAKEHSEALVLLDKCMRTLEAHDGGVAPWYYEQAAIIHRKCGDREAEVGVLRRFAAQQHAPGASPPKLLERLAKLEATA